MTNKNKNISDKLTIHLPKDFFHIDYLFNPIPAAAILLMALNDHLFKYQWPSEFTGKLSDFLGMFYFPLFLVALYCLIKNYLFKVKPTAYITKIII